MRFTLRQLHLFVAVARAQSVTAAADEMALSQSAVSAALAELERGVSTALFDRVGKRLVLNDEGRRLLPQALRVLDGARDIEQDFAGRTEGGWLRIGASRTIGSYVLPQLLARWLRQAPWRLELRVANTHEIVEAVDAFEVDVGLIEGTCHIPALATSPWLDDALVVVAAADDPLATSHAADARVSLQALRQARWLLREPGSGTREAVEQQLLAQLHGTVDALTIDDTEAIKRCVAAGAGLSCLSAWAVADLLEAGRLVALRTDLAPMSRRFQMVRHRDKRPSRTMAAFIEHLWEATHDPPAARHATCSSSRTMSRKKTAPKSLP